MHCTVPYCPSRSTSRARRGGARAHRRRETSAEPGPGVIGEAGSCSGLSPGHSLIGDAVAAAGSPGLRGSAPVFERFLFRRRSRRRSSRAARRPSAASTRANNASSSSAGDSGLSNTPVDLQQQRQQKQQGRASSSSERQRHMSSHTLRCLCGHCPSRACCATGGRLPCEMVIPLAAEQLVDLSRALLSCHDVSIAVGRQKQPTSC